MIHKNDTPAECPACHSPRVAAIVYGLMEFTPELERDLEEGRIVLGGCEVTEESKRWECVDCCHSWGDMNWGEPPLDWEEPI